MSVPRILILIAVAAFSALLGTEAAAQSPQFPLSTAPDNHIVHLTVGPVNTCKPRRRCKEFITYNWLTELATIPGQFGPH
jgi:hypothetical protein